jgi:hypothetical protein
MKKLITYLLTFLLLLPCFIFTGGMEVGAEGYATPDLLNGTDNLFLSYTFNYKSPASGHRSKEGYKPLVGYYDTDGKLQDIFFDSYLFLPCVTTAPSGGSIYRDTQNPSNFSDWQLFVEDCFLNGYNIPALNEAVGEVKAALGSQFADFKANVFLTILYPTQTQKNFGDVDGDGKTENFNNIEDRKKAVKWIVDTQIARFKNANYSNLNLVGFYWFEEFIASDSQEKPLITYMNDYVHSLNYKTIWIPYNSAAGYSKWAEYGFDVACYQPNYMFRETATSSLVTSTCQTASRLGMGVEIEASHTMLKSVEYYNRYLDYLKLCTKAGANTGIKMYYNDAVDGVFYAAYKSEYPEIRRIYDYTYKYASQKLNPDELIYLEAWKKYEGFDIVSLGCDYTATKSYTDTTSGYGKVSGDELTDGVFGSSDYNTEWIAFHSRTTESDKSYHIDIDLGRTIQNLNLFSLELNDVQSSGISLPTSVEYFISDNGTDYKSIGFGEITRKPFAYYLSTLVLDTPVKARYVRAKILPGTHVFVFVSEMSVGVPAGTKPAPALRVNNAPITVDNDNKLCVLLGEKMTPSAISGKFSHTVTFKLEDGRNAGSNDKLGTGCKISYYNEGKLVDTYNIIVYGDLDADGEVTSVDYLLMKKAYLGNLTLDNNQKMAADVDHDGVTDVTDIFLTKKHIIGTANIYS